jgi:hypothetical protein
MEIDVSELFLTLKLVSETVEFAVSTDIIAVTVTPFEYLIVDIPADIELLMAEPVLSWLDSAQELARLLFILVRKGAVEPTSEKGSK